MLAGPKHWVCIWLAAHPAGPAKLAIPKQPPGQVHGRRESSGVYTCQARYGSVVPLTDSPVPLQEGAREGSKPFQPSCACGRGLQGLIISQSCKTGAGLLGASFSEAPWDLITLFWASDNIWLPL